MKKFYTGKKILVTGACGTVGREIARQLVSFKPAEIRLVDNNEAEMFYLMDVYNREGHICFLGDIRDNKRMEQLSKDIDIIVHLAAYKHVVLSEYNPFDVVQTNVIGVENIIRAAITNNVSHVLFTSSDKAVNPTNVMGASKLMGEKLFTAANAIAGNGGNTMFASTRFGNVLGSRGSVVPLFAAQIKQGGPITITNEQMTRFVMSKKEAAKLVLKSITISCGGEIFVTKMPVIRIVDLADVMIEILAPKYGYKPSDIKKIVIGAKVGEKHYEELLSMEEVHRSMELKDMFVITPAFKSIYQFIHYQYTDVVSDRVNGYYVSSSEICLNKTEVKKYILKNNILETAKKNPNGGTSP